MIRSDEPIGRPEDDVLGRAHLAAVIAGEIRRIDAKDGFVVGVLGPWGSGKTSLINLIRLRLAEEPAFAVLEFNPWMFSGADELVERFFIELSAQLKQEPSKFTKAAELVGRYGKVISPLKHLPIAGSLFEGARELTEVVAALAEERKGGVIEHRQKLRDGLRELGTGFKTVRT